MTRSDFIGIDLTSSPATPSACIGLDKNLRLSFAGLVSADRDLEALVLGEAPLLVAIDAPLSLPKGLCCLEESCRCQPEQGPGRECERQLAGLGIPCYFTTKRSIIKEMTYRAITLRRTLENRGHRVIEVYPYGSKVRLWGRRIPSKHTPDGLDFLHSRLGELLPGLRRYVSGFSHDLCDAALAAYTAYLDCGDRTDRLGSDEEGVICVPRCDS